MRAHRLLAVGGQLLEGPYWEPRRARLLFVDIDGHELLALDWDTLGLSRLTTAEAPSAWIPRRRGGYAVASRRGLRLAEHEDSDGELAVPIEADCTGNRSNDAKCDPAGRLWFGTMGDEAAPGAAALYRVDPELRVTAVLGGVTISNGLGWSPDGRLMYYVDTPTHRIDVFDYDIATGEASGRRTFADVSDLAGMPDGMALDREGCLWVAFHDGAAVHRFAPDGAHVDTVEVPVQRPTSCAFAGSDLEALVITTAGHAADLFVCEPGTAGLAVAAFGG